VGGALARRDNGKSGDAVRQLLARMSFFVEFPVWFDSRRRVERSWRVGDESEGTLQRRGRPSMTRSVVRIAAVT
jgi:hypothetical protein